MGGSAPLYSPLYILIYVKDIFTVVTPSRFLLFTDDPQYVRYIRNLTDCSVLQISSTTSQFGLTNEGIKFNIFKYTHERFGSSFFNKDVTINSFVITTITDYKDLGVLINSFLSFSPHLKNIFSKAYRSLGLIRGAFPSVVTNFRKNSIFNIS